MLISIEHERSFTKFDFQRNSLEKSTSEDGDGENQNKDSQKAEINQDLNGEKTDDLSGNENADEQKEDKDKKDVICELPNSFKKEDKADDKEMSIKDNKKDDDKDNDSWSEEENENTNDFAERVRTIDIDFDFYGF